MLWRSRRIILLLPLAIQDIQDVSEHYQVEQTNHSTLLELLSVPLNHRANNLKQ